MQNQQDQDVAWDELMTAARIHAYNSANMRSVRAYGQRLADLTISEALRLHAGPSGGWNLDVPWTGSSGDADLDARLAQAYRALLACSSHDDCLRFIEREVWRPEMFPHPDAPADRYCETLTRWWLDLFEEARCR